MRMFKLRQKNNNVTKNVEMQKRNKHLRTSTNVIIGTLQNQLRFQRQSSASHTWPTLDLVWQTQEET